MVSEHDRVQHVEIAPGRLIDHGAGVAAVEREEQAVAEGNLVLALLQNHRQRIGSMRQLAREIHGERSDDFPAGPLLPGLRVAEGIPGRMCETVDDRLSFQGWLQFLCGAGYPTAGESNSPNGVVKRDCTLPTRSPFTVSLRSVIRAEGRPGCLPDSAEPLEIVVS